MYKCGIQISNNPSSEHGFSGFFYMQLSSRNSHVSLKNLVETHSFLFLMQKTINQNVFNQHHTCLGCFGETVKSEPSFCRQHEFLDMNDVVQDQSLQNGALAIKGLNLRVCRYLTIFLQKFQNVLTNEQPQL